MRFEELAYEFITILKSYSTIITVIFEDEPNLNTLKEYFEKFKKIKTTMGLIHQMLLKYHILKSFQKKLKKLSRVVIKSTT
jgi:hypothetical protein